MIVFAITLGIVAVLLGVAIHDLVKDAADTWSRRLR